MQYFAHSDNSYKKKHSLKEHLLQTAGLAASFAESFGCSRQAWYLGLLHDLGKYHPDFQRYLNDPDIKKGPNHSGVGAMFADKNALRFYEIPLLCHHSGLKNSENIKKRLRKDEKEKQIYEISIPFAKEDITDESDIFTDNSSIPELFERPKNNEKFKNKEVSRRMEFKLRMLFSSLVDADFLDTEKHFDSSRTTLREKPENSDFSVIFEKFTNKQRAIFGSKTGRLNEMRNEIYEACLTSAENKPGIFRLAVPTGGGKTLSSLAFALKHCVRNGMPRIIYSIPYTGIIEQTADVFREVLGDDAVLEHHSSIDFRDEDEEKTNLLKLAAENWDYPIIVTTNVQLFESLFANRTSKCRKLHNITRSVIILDEVQTLPLHILSPTIDVLQTLVDEYGVSIVLCTATQPALDDNPGFKGLKDIRDILPDSHKYFNSLKRVEYEFPRQGEVRSRERTAQEMLSSRQALCIMNTKKDAADLFFALKSQVENIESLFHLSTTMCAAHRRDILAIIRKKLERGEECYLVSTQVVEAGVDIDFPLVLRAMGPLDRIVQAAGRCNREGRNERGRTVIFTPEDSTPPPGEYRKGHDQAVSFLSENKVDMEDQDFYRRYFLALYQIVDLDKHEIQKSREHLRYEDVAENYKLIRDDGVSVIVRYKPAEEFIDSQVKLLRKDFANKRKILRKLQQYMVNIRRYEEKSLVKDGLITPIFEGLYEWTGRYDDFLGIQKQGIAPDLLVL